MSDVNYLPHEAFGKEAVTHFAKDDSAFKSLIEAMISGDLESTIKIAREAKLSEPETSLLIRDSAALASFVLRYGSEACW